MMKGVFQSISLLRADVDFEDGDRTPPPTVECQKVPAPRRLSFAIIFGRPKVKPAPSPKAKPVRCNDRTLSVLSPVLSRLSDTSLN